MRSGDLKGGMGSTPLPRCSCAVTIEPCEFVSRMVNA